MADLYSTHDGPAIQQAGQIMFKKRNPVYMMQISAPFEVETNEGRLRGNAGDYVAHDPISGHVWPVAADYVAMHYEP